MVERVALAMYAHMSRNEPAGEWWERERPAYKEYTRNLALVAIAAMGEPTDAMVTAGSYERSMEYSEHRIYQAMIDAALK